MTDGVITQHPPAVKVAGRRLSMSAKHRPHPTQEQISDESEGKNQDNADYPRPSSNAPIRHEYGHNNYEEEMPHRKDKKQNSEKRKTQEHVYWKSETTRPTHDYNVGQKAQNMQISQPTGKGFNV